MKPYEQGQWAMFLLITSAWYGKQYYFYEESLNRVWSRKSCKYLTVDEAYIEFLDEFGHE